MISISFKTLYWLKIRLSNLRNVSSIAPFSGTTCCCLLYPGKNWTEAHQAFSRYSMEFCCGDDWVCVVSSSPSRQTCWDGMAQYRCKDPPSQAQDFGEGVGHSVPIGQSSFSMSSLIFFKLADTNFFDSHSSWQLSSFPSRKYLCSIKLFLSSTFLPNIWKIYPATTTTCQQFVQELWKDFRLAILNKYYSKTDESIMYRCTISMFCLCFMFRMVSNLNFIVLHPKYKLTYFWSKKWPDELVNAARLVLREQWTTYYKPSDSEEPGSNGSQSSASNSELVSFNTFLLEYMVDLFIY